MVVCDWCVMNLTHAWWVLIQSWMLDVVLSDPHFWNLSSTISIYIRVRSYVNSLVSVFLLLFFLTQRCVYGFIACRCGFIVMFSSLSAFLGSEIGILCLLNYRKSQRD